MNGSIGKWFRTTVGVRQGCPLQHFSGTDHARCSGRIGDRNLTNLQFADDIDVVAVKDQELEALVGSIESTKHAQGLRRSSVLRRPNW